MSIHLDNVPVCCCPILVAKEEKKKRESMSITQRIEGT